MTRIIQSLDEIDAAYRAVFCDLWGCLHDGIRAFPQGVAALQRFKDRGGAVVLITNSPRPADGVAAQMHALGVPPACYDVIATSGDAAQEALQAGVVGRRVHHIGPTRDAAFFHLPDGTPVDVVRVPLGEAEGLVCTGLFDDRSETPDDYRALLLEAKARGLKLLCANPDIVVDVGEQRIFCAGAIAKAYDEAGGESLYFGKPHPPIYALARARIAKVMGRAPEAGETLCIGDGIATDVLGAVGEDLDVLFITGGLAVTETGTTAAGPDPARLAAYLREMRLAPRLAMAYLR